MARLCSHEITQEATHYSHGDLWMDVERKEHRKGKKKLDGKSDSL
jgi:hypothetical protein